MTERAAPWSWRDWLHDEPADPLEAEAALQRWRAGEPEREQRTVFSDLARERATDRPETGPSYTVDLTGRR